MRDVYLNQYDGYDTLTVEMPGNRNSHMRDIPAGEFKRWAKSCRIRLRVLTTMPVRGRDYHTYEVDVRNPVKAAMLKLTWL